MMETASINPGNIYMSSTYKRPTKIATAINAKIHK